MKKYIRFLLIPALLFICAAHKGHPPTTPAFMEPTYTFGDDMMYFVQNQAYTYAANALENDYASRSLNGFMVTLDKNRIASNNATGFMAQTDSLLIRAYAGYSTFKKKSENPGYQIPDEGIAALARFSEQIGTACKDLNDQHYKVTIAAKNLPLLLQPLEFEGFREAGLDQLPLHFIMTSIGGTKPDFNTSISINVTIYGDNSENQNAANAGFFLLGAWQAYQDERLYEQQVEKFNDAMEILPRMLPDSEKCYKVYKEQFESIRDLAGEEPLLMIAHSRSLILALDNRYKTLLGIKASIDNLLLSDRVRAASGFLSLDSFDVEGQEIIKKRAGEIHSARQRIIRLRAVIFDNPENVKKYYAAEEIIDASLFIGELIAATDTIPVYIPIRSRLEKEKKWFVLQSEWAKKVLAGNEKIVKKNRKSINPKLEDFLKKNYEGELSASPATRSKIVQSPVPAFSVIYGWPGDGSAGSHQSHYFNGGLEVWTRTADGSFRRDARNPGHGLISQTRANLEQRTEELAKNFQAAHEIVSSGRISRTSEIAMGNQQLNLTEAVTGTTAANLASLNQTILPGSVALPATVDPDLRFFSTSELPSALIGTETSRQEHLEGNRAGTPEFMAYSQLHDKYITYAGALWEGGFQGNATDMFYAAVGLRSAMQGYPAVAFPQPGFDPPAVPFNPFTKEDYDFIFERCIAYRVINESLKSKSKWFEAAAIVTNSTIVFADMQPDAIYIFSHPMNFLKETNAYLFDFNVSNSVKIMSGTLNDSFIAADGEVIDFTGKQGRELDMALVKFEQTKVEAYIRIYKEKYPEADMKSVFSYINAFMKLSVLLPPEVRSAMPVSFDFESYADRVRLGQQIIDQLYEP